jgi:hypothetical protein
MKYSIEKFIQYAENRIEYGLQGQVQNNKVDSPLWNKLTPDQLGMSGSVTRVILNNLCDRPSCSYMEVGLATGSTFCAATYKNEHQDNQFIGFDVWDGTFHKADGDRMKTMFKNNFKKYVGSISERQDTIEIVDGNFFKFNLVDLFNSKNLKPVNIYFYDAEHTDLASYYALIYAYDILDDYFIYIVDDWNDVAVRAAAFSSLKDSGVLIHKFWCLGCEAGKSLYRPDGKWKYPEVDPVKDFGDYRSFFNGVGIFVLEKNKKSYFDLCRDGKMLKIGTPDIPQFQGDPLLEKWAGLMCPPGNFDDLLW